MIRLSVRHMTAMAAVSAVREYGRSLPVGPEFHAVRELVKSLAFAVNKPGWATAFYLSAEDAQRLYDAVGHTMQCAVRQRMPHLVLPDSPLMQLWAMLPYECREVEPADAYDPDVCPAP